MKGTSISTFTGRSGTVITKHAGYPKCHWYEKDHCIRFTGNYYGYYIRHTVRYSILGKELIMKTIKILGTGCAKCNLLYDRVKEVADSIGIEYKLERIAN